MMFDKVPQQVINQAQWRITAEETMMGHTESRERGQTLCVRERMKQEDLGNLFSVDCEYLSSHSDSLVLGVTDNFAADDPNLQKPDSCVCLDRIWRI